MAIIYNPKRTKFKALFVPKLGTGGTVNPSGTPTPPSFTNTYSLAFDGVDDEVAVSEVIYSSDFTFSFWVKPSNFTLAFVFGDINSNASFLRLKTATTIQFNFGGSTYTFTETAGNDLVLNSWQHIMVTRDGSNNVKGFRNGVAFGSSTVKSGNFEFNRIGSVYNPGNWHFNGNIDEFAVWNSDQSANIDSIYSASGAVDLTSLNPTAWYRNGDNGSYKSPQWLIPENSNKDKFSNYSFQYDGVDDFVDLGTSSTLEFIDDFTVSVWIKDTASLNRGVFCCGDRLGTSGWMIYRTSANKVAFSVYTVNNRIATSTTSINTGDWFNVIGTFEKNGTANQQVKVYVNGSFEGQNGWASPQTPTYSGTIYKQIAFPYAGSNEFLGNIDEVSAFNYLLSTDEINTISTTPSDLSSLSPVGYWRGEQSNFTDNWLVDNSALSNYSTRSFAFDGVDDYIDVGNPASLQITGALSISAWVKFIGNDVAIVSKWESGSSSRPRSYALFADSFGTNHYPSFVIYNSGSSYQALGATRIDDGNWHHVLGTFNPSTYVRLYVDGNLDAENTTSIPATIDNDPADFVIGAIKSLGNPVIFLNGSIDEVAVWNSDQSANVATIYNSGTPTDLTSLSPLSWWRMGEDATFSTNWSLPDNGSASNTGTSANMTIADLEGEASNYTGGGLSNNMTIEDRVGEAPNSTSNALSYNMTESDRETDVPT